MKSYLALILGMTAVTYLPRLAPMVALNDRPIHPKLKRFLMYVPYTALTALIVRGATQADPQMLVATLAGIGSAGICSWFKGGFILSVLVSIITAFLVLNFF